jgi:O-antigen/teichoic acid export membrane protein
LPVAGVFTFLLTDQRFVATALILTAGVALQGLSPAWFLIGKTQPYRLALIETLPRAVGLLLGVAAVVLTGELVWYAVAVCLAEAFIAALGAVLLGARDHDSGPRQPQVLAVLREQWPLMIAGLAGAGYTRAAIPIVSSVAYPAVPIFAALDRVQQFARTGVRPVVSFFQGWVVRGDTHNRMSRPFVAATLTVALGVVVACTIGVALPPLASFVFTDEIAITPAQSWLLAFTIVCLAGSYSTGLYYLVPMGLLRVFSWTSTLGALLGVPLLMILSPSLGAAGAMLAVAIVELSVLAVQVGTIVWTRKQA